MRKTVFKNTAASYLTVALLGIAAGAAVGFFMRFPADDLWGLAFFSSQTLGFWFFTTSLIVLFSEKCHTAAINAALYVYLMFFVTGVFKYLQNVHNTRTFFFDVFFDCLLYGLIPALVCAVLGMVLWFGRKRKLLFVLLRFAPALCILAEAVMFAVMLFGGHGLFMFIVDVVCFFAYLYIIIINSDFKKTEGDNKK